MSKKLTAKSADDAIGSIAGRDTLINGEPFTVIERRHVLIGNAIYYRLRVRTTKTGVAVQIDVPIETNAPSQLELLDVEIRHVQETALTDAEVDKRIEEVSDE